MTGPIYNRKSGGRILTVVDPDGNNWEIKVTNRTFTPFNPPVDRLYAVIKGTEFPIYVFSKRKNGRWVLKGKPQSTGPYIVNYNDEV